MASDEPSPIPALAARTGRELLLAIASCPIMEAHLEGRGGDEGCEEVVLHQWANVPSVEARRRRWRREHHTPVPWVGHLESAPILFVSSNPNLTEADLRKPDEVPIPEPEPLPALGDATSDEHPSLNKPFRAAKNYWDDDEIADYYENVFDVWVKADGVRPLSATSERRREVDYWKFAREQAEQIIEERPLRAGAHYALTEVVHCKSAGESGVEAALAPCADRYLRAVLGLSPASVIVLAGAKAAEAFQLVCDIPVQKPGTMIGPVPVGGRERLVLYLRHPGWLRRHPEQAEASVLPTVLSSEQLGELRTAAAP